MHRVSEVPPLPPADLHERSLALTGPAGEVLWRIHRTDLDPFFFGPPAGVRPAGRWDAAAGQFGVCYFAEEPRVAFAETLLRGPGAIVSEKDVAMRSLARFEVVLPLRLVMVHGPGLRRMGATAAVSSGPHEFSRTWSLALHEHPSRPDGVLYRVRHDDDGVGVALFDRARSAVRLLSSRSLLDPELADELGGWLDTYDAGLA